MGSLSKYEQETVINFNAGEQTAVVYTRDKAVMRKLDALVIAFPEVYKLVGETDIDKTYSMPKSCVSYRKPRKLNDKYRELKRVQINYITEHTFFSTIYLCILYCFICTLFSSLYLSFSFLGLR